MAETYWLLWNHSSEFDNIDSIDTNEVMYCFYRSLSLTELRYTFISTKTLKFCNVSVLVGSTHVFVYSSSVVVRCFISFCKHGFSFQWIDFKARFGENYMILRANIHCILRWAGKYYATRTTSVGHQLTFLRKFFPVYPLAYRVLYELFVENLLPNHWVERGYTPISSAPQSNAVNETKREKKITKKHFITFFYTLWFCFYDFQVYFIGVNSKQYEQ